jgi:DNA-binding CsgD family transcriptional regulator
MNISIANIKNKVGIKGSDLNSRDWGIKIRKEIEVQIKTAAVNDQTIYLDFSGITSFNSSIADEVIILLMEKIIRDKNFKKIYMVTQNIPDNSLYDLELVSFHRKIPCLVKFNDKKHPDIVYGKNASKMESNQLTVFDLVTRIERCTARKIADIMKKDIYTISTYLNRLYKLRLLRREEQIDSQGKQYLYMPVI